MKDQIKDNIIFFLLGLLIGGMITVLGGVIVYKIIKSPRGLPSFSFSGSGHSTSTASIPMKNFNLSFENTSDLSFFQASEGAEMEESASHATEGKKSLLVKLPAGKEYPGISWEVYGKEVLSWKEGKQFVFHAYNNTESEIQLQIKIKSGRDYPKKSFSTICTLNPLSDNEVRLSLEDIASQCELEAISYIKIFVQNPSRPLILYIDHMRIEK
jgi:hypothetical protein